jgi:hypothetical protein
VKPPSWLGRRRLTPKNGAPLIGRPRCQHLTDTGADIAGDVNPKIIAVGKIDLWGGDDEAVDQSPALGVEHPGGLHLRQRRDQLLQPQMQRLFARNNIGIGNVTDDLGDLGQAAVDRLEHLQRMLVRDIERALDFAVGGVTDRDPGDRGGEYEERQRKGQ